MMTWMRKMTLTHEHEHKCGGPFVHFCLCGAAHEGCTVVHTCMVVARQQVQSQQLLLLGLAAVAAADDQPLLGPEALTLLTSHLSDSVLLL
jgi:hypothetical protein